MPLYALILSWLFLDLGDLLATVIFFLNTFILPMVSQGSLTHVCKVFIMCEHLSNIFLILLFSCDFDDQNESKFYAYAGIYTNLECWSLKITKCVQ